MSATKLNVSVSVCFVVQKTVKVNEEEAYSRPSSLNQL